MSVNKYCVIMAGGIGARFWPKSRVSKPKQFLDVLGVGKSLLRQTYERFLPLVESEKFLVVTNARYRDLVMEQIPELDPSQVLCEPFGRNTAPAIAYAAYTLQKRDPMAEMIVTPSDHYINNEEVFRSIVEECSLFSVANDTLITIGVSPTRPETGYGYIQVSDRSQISRAKSFTEKPMVELAQTFLQCGEFVWNSGVFVWSLRNIIDAFERYMPEYHALFSSLAEAIGTDREEAELVRVFSESPAISIDRGVMERADNVYVRVGEFGWSDIGTWGSIYPLSKKDKYGNACDDNAILYDSRGSIVSLPDGKVAVISGLKEYIVVDTDDLLMICPREEEQNMKKYLNEVKYRKGDDFM